MPLATEYPIIPFLSGAVALTQGKVVKISSATVIVTTAATEAAFGVVTEPSEASAMANIAPAGSGAIVYVEAAASGIAAGDNLVPAASGQCNKSTTSTHKVFAIALEASTAQGQLIKAVLSPPYYTLP